MTGGQTSKRRFNNMACTVLVGILVNKTIGAPSSDSSSENALSFRASPFARLLALFESLNCAGGQGGASSLCNALLAFLTLAAAAVATGTARIRL
jgi:hypothetical protein